jgi:hypothetical protein
MFKRSVPVNKAIGGGIPPLGVIDPLNPIQGKPDSVYQRFEVSAVYDF